MGCYRQLITGLVAGLLVLTACASETPDLTTTQVNVTVPEFARADQPLQITAQLTPGAARPVKVEVSGDGANWSTVTEGTSNDAGTFTFAAEGFERGERTVRIVAGATETAAEGSGEAKTTIEDYEAAGQFYLDTVAPINALMKRWDKDVADTAKFALARKLCDQYVVEYGKQSDALAGYEYWPHDVQPLADSAAERAELSQQYYRRAAKSKTDETFVERLGDVPASLKRLADVPKNIRAALGLPPPPG